MLTLWGSSGDLIMEKIKSFQNFMGTIIKICPVKRHLLQNSAGRFIEKFVNVLNKFFRFLGIKINLWQFWDGRFIQISFLKKLKQFCPKKHILNVRLINFTKSSQKIKMKPNYRIITIKHTAITIQKPKTTTMSINLTKLVHKNQSINGWN